MSKIIEGQTINKEDNRIAFKFSPYEFDKRNHAIEKSDENGVRRRYLLGISSGTALDGHEERMTEKCIKSFSDQANSGTILLYPDVHGIKQSDDIGILTAQKILDNGDWYTEYRLYDSLDNIGAVKQEKIDTIWNQIKGLPPYTKPLQKGYSIEGYIPVDGILSAQKDDKGNLTKRVLDNVLLDGVCLVPRPAYQPSIASAVYKALHELPPQKIDKIQKKINKSLNDILDDKEAKTNYFHKKYQIQDALEEIIEGIMKSDDFEKQKQLEIAFEEYKQLMIGILLQSESTFQNENESNDNEVINPYNDVSIGKASKLEVYKSIHYSLNQLLISIKNRRKT